MSWAHKSIIWCFRLLFVLVPLVFLPNTSELFEFNKLILTYIITILIVFFWLSRMVVEGKWLFKKTFLDWPLVIFLISQFVSLLFSIDSRTSWMGYYSRFNGGFLSLLCYSILYWSAVTHLDSKSTKSIINYSLVTGALVSFYGVLESFGIDKNLWVQDVQTRVFSTLGQPNWLAAYICALIFIALANISKFIFPWQAQKSHPAQITPEMEKSAWKFTGNWFLFILLFVTLLFTKSRSGIAAFGIGSSIFWILTFIKSKFEFKNTFIYFLIFSLAFFFIIPTPFRDLIFKSAAPPQAAVSTGTALESGGTESGEIRKIVWQGALNIWHSSAKTWWIGTGPETFAMAYYQHRPIAHNSTSEWELLYNKAHNEYLNYLATTGVLGLGSYLVLLGFMLYTLIKSQNPNYKIQTNSNQKNSTQLTNFEIGKYNLLVAALLAGWITIPLTNFLGFSVVIIQILMFLLPAFAITLNIPPQSTDSRLSTTKSKLWLILIFFLSPVLALIYLVSTYWLADTYYAAGQKDLHAFSATQDPTYLYNSYQEYLEAFKLNDADPPIASDLSIVTAYLAVVAREQQPQLSQQLLDTSIAAGLRAVTISPYHPNYYKSLSRTYIILSSLDVKYLVSADQTLASAQEISPTDPRIPFNRGIIAQYRKDYISAEKYYREALALRPQFGDATVALNAVATMSAQTH